MPHSLRYRDINEDEEQKMQEALADELDDEEVRIREDDHTLLRDTVLAQEIAQAN